jgi:hypothetical protein
MVKWLQNDELKNLEENDNVLTPAFAWADEEIMKNLNHRNWCPYQASNQIPQEYKSRALPLY